MVRLSPEKLEQGFLSSHCSVEGVLEALGAGVDEESFASQQNTDVWNYMVARATAGDAIAAHDINTLFDVTLDDTLVDKETWLNQIMDVTIARKTKRILQDTVLDLDRKPAQTVRKIVVELGELSHPSQSKSTYYDRDVLKRLEEYLEDKAKVEAGESVNTSTGLKVLDKTASRGIKVGELLLVLGRHNIGKSSMLVSFCAEAYMEGKKILYLSPESPVTDVRDRFDVILSRKFGFEGFTLTQITNKEPSEEYEKYLRFLAENEKGNLLIRDSGDQGAFSITDVLAYTREFRPDVLAIDGFHLIDTGGESWQAMRDAARQVKGLALSLDCVVYTVSQVQREAVQAVDEIPELGKSAYGLGLEEAADKIIGLGSKRNAPLQRVWKLIKNRNGKVPVKRQYLTFDLDNGYIVDDDLSDLETEEDL